jgi:hypothetical protein
MFSVSCVCFSFLFWRNAALQVWYQTKGGVKYGRGFYVFVIFSGTCFFFVIDGDGFEFRGLVLLLDKLGLVG